MMECVVRCQSGIENNYNCQREVPQVITKNTFAPILGIEKDEVIFYYICVEGYDCN